MAQFYGVRPPSIPTQSLCGDKPVSKSIGLRIGGLLRTGRGRPAVHHYFPSLQPKTFKFVRNLTDWL